MNLTEHAKRELKIAGLFDKDSDYDGDLGKAVLELIKTFAKQGHSGMSAALTLEVFTKLARFQNLTPLTDNPDEWMNVTDKSASGTDLWQSTRKYSCFSEDAGITYYDIDDKNKKIYIAVKTEGRYK